MNRNEPCWCGSGRKFKKCHGGPDAPVAGDDTLSITRRSEIARASAAKTVDVALMKELHEYAYTRYGPRLVHGGGRRFFDGRPAGAQR